MITSEPLLVMVVGLVNRCPALPPTPHGRGRPDLCINHLFLKALVVMIVRCLRTSYELLAVLEQPTC